jgi:hypothetical protein
MASNSGHPSASRTQVFFTESYTELTKL